MLLGKSQRGYLGLRKKRNSNFNLDICCEDICCESTD